MTEVREIRRRVLRIDQDPEHPLYLFGLTGAELLEIADISRVSRMTLENCLDISAQR